MLESRLPDVVRDAVLERGDQELASRYVTAIAELEAATRAAAGLGVALGPRSLFRNQFDADDIRIALTNFGFPSAPWYRGGEMVRLDAPLRPEVKVSRAEAQAASAPTSNSPPHGRETRAPNRTRNNHDRHYRLHPQRQHRWSNDFRWRHSGQPHRRGKCAGQRMAHPRGRANAARKRTAAVARAAEVAPDRQIQPPGPEQMLSLAEVDAALAAAHMEICDRMTVKSALSDLGMIA